MSRPEGKGHPVEDYYERNTRAFLRFGGGPSAGAIHRALWGPGVASAGQALDYINLLLYRAIAESTSTAAPVLLDIGCGVGGTLIRLATLLPAAHCHGITISPTQCQLAEQAGRRAGLADRCAFHAANFESARLPIKADAAIAVESFVHSRSPAAFFETAAAHLQPGGRLFLVDDFLIGGDSAAGLANRFRRGWRASSFGSVAACAGAAGAAGLDVVGERDLSALIRLDRPRDRLVAIAGPVCAALGLEAIPYCGNLIGGSALRKGLKKGAFSYLWLELRKRPA